MHGQHLLPGPGAAASTLVGPLRARGSERGQKPAGVRPSLKPPSLLTA